MSEARLRREAAFHDRAFTDRTRQAAGRFYAAAASGKQVYRELIGLDCRGRTILEYGCGTGSAAFDLAREGARVVGIDISSAGIGMARRRAAAEGLADRLSFQVMNAEALAFAAGTFDAVCGSGILHHLELDRALAELRRVLRPEGSAVFFEPLGHNPLINLFRRFTPSMRSADEHPLRIGDLRLLSAGFARVDCRFFALSSLLAVPFGGLPGSGAALRALEAVDRALFRLPFFRKQAWIVVVRLSGRRPIPGTGRNWRW
jgi:SAM-dependent methyltransferase